MSKRRTTIKDLAVELNTTPSTVSRALRQDPAISKEMRERVQSLAKLMNYRVNRIASNLRNGKSKTIGVIVPHINRDFFSNVISGIEDVSYDKKYNVIICQTHDDYAKEVQYVKTLVSSNADGILASIGLRTKNIEHFNSAMKLGIPVIFFDRVSKKSPSINIVNDDFKGAYIAVSHLIEMGYRRIAHFAGPDYLNVYRDRKNGYIKALEDYGITPDPELVVYNDLKVSGGRSSTQMLLKMATPPDAIFSASDYSALGALLYLKEQGIKIPREMGIVGYSNEKFTELTAPSLTSIDQHGYEMGQYSAKLFFEEMDKKDNDFLPRTITLTPKLIIRESSSLKNT